MAAHRSDVLTGAGRLPRARIVAAVILIGTLLIAGLGGPSQAAPATPVASPMASPLASPAASPVTTAGERPGANIIVGQVTVEISDTGFSPTHFESAVGRDVTINLVNTGSRPHNFTMAAFDIDIDLAPGETASVDIPLPDLGEYPYTSSAPGDEEFAGTMVVFL